MQTLSFEALDLIEPIQHALRAQNYSVPTPIQQQAIPLLLAGNDLMGSAQTGSGKTAAFALPILQHLALHRRSPQKTATRTLILAPTRELVAQIADSFAAYGRHLGLRQATVYGGVGKYGQIQALQRGVDILTATPGRLLDLLGDGVLRLDRVEIFVLDEADRMLDMGFIPAINRVIAELPAVRQSLFFSATLPPEVISLARSMLIKPSHVAVAREVDQAPDIDQRVLFVERENKTALLLSLLKDRMTRRVLVFTRTKHRAHRLSQALVKARIRSDSLHGNKSQSARRRALAAFHAGRIRVLVATDIAARGIDVEDISHVINFELPNEPESYVHRIGRTARAGKTGTALSFCDPSENDYLRRIERLLKHKMSVVRNHLFVGPYAPGSVRAPSGANRPKPNRRSHRRFTR
jgi:ATP-dependent RNA helicase RhlE